MGQKHAGPQAASAPGRPTCVRLGVLALITLMAALLYLDRVCISAAGLVIAPDLGLDKEQLGYVYGSFFFAYGLAQVPAGWLGDRLGARRVLTVAVLAWSLCTAWTGLATGLATLLAARLLLGVCQAAAYPLAARINSVWMPFPRRAVGSAVITLGGRAGGALAPVATACLMAWLGWRPTFGIYALLGVGWAAVFCFWFRATPAEHPGCNAAEVALIEPGRQGRAGTMPGPAQGLPWRAALRSTSLWMQCLTQLTANIPWALLVTWLPTYLAEVYHVDAEAASGLASLTLLAGVAGCLLGGLVTDRLTAALGLKWGRNLPGLGSKVLATLGLLLCMAAPNAGLATAGLAFMSFGMDLGLGATWAYFQDAGGGHVATFLGWANMFGNLGAAVSSILLGGLAAGFGWNAALAVCAALFVLSGLCWLAIDARVPIIRSPDL